MDAVRGARGRAASGIAAGAGGRHSARLASGGLVGVLAVLTAFPGAVPCSTPAAPRPPRRGRISELYQAVERALLVEDSAEHEFLYKRGEKQRATHTAAANAVLQTLEAVRAAEEDDHRAHVDELIAQQEHYLAAAAPVFDQVQRTVPRAGQAEDAELVPQFRAIQEVVAEEAAEHRQEASEAVEALGRTQRLVLLATPVVFGLGLALVALFALVLRDRRQIDSQASQNRHQALHDALTGLANRTLLRQRGEPLLAQALQDGEPAALMLIDLDRFKEIRDTLGHSYGDVVLKAVADRLQQSLRSTDTVARLGGDEFVVLLPAVGSVEAALDVAGTLRQVLEASIEADGVWLDVEASIGLVLSGQHGDDIDALLQHADIAMYAAKERGLGVCVYDDDLNGHSPERLGLLGELRRALDLGELVLHYQPKVALVGENVCGVEALVRWQHPQRGMVPPNLFIPLAERTGLIRPLTRYVLAAALAQCRRWQDAGRTLQVAVNISARNLLDERFVADVTASLDTWRVPAARLELEVTESAIMADPERARQVLGRLSDLGVTLSIDDFGAGYTSLAHLKNLPVHQLKIDRSFVGSMTRDRSDALIVRSVVELGHNLGLTTIAEGVEDRETSERLLELGCDVGQGYLYSRPLPAEQLVAWFDATVLRTPSGDATGTRGELLSG